MTDRSRLALAEQLQEIAGISTFGPDRLALLKAVDILREATAPTPAVPAPADEIDWRQRFERAQQRWGNLKVRIKSEIAALDVPGMKPQQRSQYANGIARLNWVLDEMRKSPDVLAEVVPLPAPPSSRPAPQECHPDACPETGERDCKRCSGEYCDVHFNDPCDCDAVARHASSRPAGEQV